MAMTVHFNLRLANYDLRFRTEKQSLERSDQQFRIAPNSRARRHRRRARLLRGRLRFDFVQHRPQSELAGFGNFR